jgi:hypothetical protein
MTVPASAKIPETTALLEYYANSSIHHRSMMVGFVSMYFAITQLLWLTPTDSLAERDVLLPIAIIAGIGILATFVLAATLHHACHFCATAGLRALMASHLHYHQLPENEDSMNEFTNWLAVTAKKVRRVTAVRSFSTYILGALLCILVVANAGIFLFTAKQMLQLTDFQSGVAITAFVCTQAMILILYAIIFKQHYTYLVIARDELAVVLQSTSQKEVLKKVKDRAKQAKT